MRLPPNEAMHIEPATPVLRELELRGADGIEHPGGTLSEHLLRTRSKLDSWGAEPALVTAGLCHAAYGTHGFPAALFRLEERPRLRALIGEEAEAIVYAYCALDREYYVRAGAESAELGDRFRGERFVPAALMRRQLAELIAANELDLFEQTSLSSAEAAGIFELIGVGERQLSEAARAAYCTAAALEMRSRADPEIAYLDVGTQGEPVLFWHGGAGPELTWSRQHCLSVDHRLRIPWRRGLAPSASASVHDWEPDARDLLRLMPGAVHVVAHSWGGLSALSAAARAPERFRSLVVIEPPLWTGADNDPEVAQLVALARAFIAGKPEARSAFLALVGMPLDHPDSLRIDGYARYLRDPGELHLDFTRLRAANTPVVVASGEHARGLERLCDQLASDLGATRLRLRGAGHAVQRHPQFNEHLRALVHSTV